MIFAHENIAIVMLTEDKMLLFGSPHRGNPSSNIRPDPVPIF